MITIHVSASKNYDIHIAAELLPMIGEKARALLPRAEKAAVITDNNVRNLYLQPVMRSLEGAGFSPFAFSFPPGEQSKTAEQYLVILNWLCENQITRSDVIIALGGGVPGDLAGFTAATYLRGIPFIQIPTTLLAMVDSSVGGKTGIDLPAGKNLAGAFYQPSLVLCDTNVLVTLPENVFSDGCAEVIKYAMLQSAALNSAPLLEQLMNIDLKTSPEEVIGQCVAIKRDIVQTDELDTGERMLLNFGHTIAHAIEKLSGYKVSHGMAVAAGMAIDTRAAARKGLCPPECVQILDNLLERYALPNKTDYPAEALYTAALHDKKRSGGEITIAVPRAPGKTELEKIPIDSLRDWVEVGIKP